MQFARYHTEHNPCVTKRLHLRDSTVHKLCKMSTRSARVRLLAQENDSLEVQILNILAEEPTLSMDGLAQRVGRNRRTCTRCVNGLVNDGLLRPKGYYPAERRSEASSIPPGMVLIKSPNISSGLSELEAVLDKFAHLGAWTFVTGEVHDYLFVLQVQSDHADLFYFFREVRALGAETDTLYVVTKG